MSQRTVDPMRLLIADGRSYLEAWCRRAEAVRLFRLDRVDDVVLLDEPAAPPPDADADRRVRGAVPAARRAPLGRAGAGARRRAGWPSTTRSSEVVELDGGRARVLLRYADPDWLVRLVLGLGGGARLLEPAELAEAVGERARAALAGGGGAG